MQQWLPPPVPHLSARTERAATLKVLPYILQLAPARLWQQRQELLLDSWRGHGFPSSCEVALLEPGLHADGCAFKRYMSPSQPWLASSILVS